jgi:hypothetical protein
VLRHRPAALAVLTVAAVTGLGGGIAVAVSTGTLPTAAGDHPHTTATTGAPTSTTGSTVVDRTPASTTATPSSHGPNVNGPAKFGLCTAFASGRGTTNGKKADSTAFQALATAAGGVANIPAFCADATPGGGPPASTAPSGADNGQVHGHDNTTSNGPPPTTGNSETGQSHRP